VRREGGDGQTRKSDQIPAEPEQVIDFRHDGVGVDRRNGEIALGLGRCRL
jgi:hypothetical protein